MIDMPKAKLYGKFYERRRVSIITKDAEVFDLFKKNPNIASHEIVQELGMSPHQAFSSLGRVKKAIEDSKKVKIKQRWKEEERERLVEELPAFSLEAPQFFETREQEKTRQNLQSMARTPGTIPNKVKMLEKGHPKEYKKFVLNLGGTKLRAKKLGDIEKLELTIYDIIHDQIRMQARRGVKGFEGLESKLATDYVEFWKKEEEKRLKREMKKR